MNHTTTPRYCRYQFSRPTEITIFFDNLFECRYFYRSVNAGLATNSNRFQRSIFFFCSQLTEKVCPHKSYIIVIVVNLISIYVSVLFFVFVFGHAAVRKFALCKSARVTSQLLGSIFVTVHEVFWCAMPSSTIVQLFTTHKQ